MDKKSNVRLVKEKLNNIDYKYEVIYDEIDRLLDENSLDLGEKKINVFGFFDFSIDFIPDVIERKTIISVIVGILEELPYLELSLDEFRVKLTMKPMNSNEILKVKKTRKDNVQLKEFIKKFYDRKLEDKFKNIDLDDKLFCYILTFILSLFEDSKFVILKHQFSLECVPLEENLIESTTSNILIEKILNKLK